MMDFGFDSFDIFNTNTVEEKKEEVKETKEVKEVVAPAADKEDKAPETAEETTATSTTPAGVPFTEDAGADIEGEDDSDELSTSDDEESEAPATKTAKKSAPKKDVKLKGVVKVVGNGWHTTYGEAGAEYDAVKVAQQLYNDGYKEIAVADIKYSATTLFVNVLNQKPSNDDVQMGDEITIELGNFKVTYKVDDFGGLTKQEISLFDVGMKFQHDNPQFAGCGLKFHNGSKVASPVFTNKATIKADQTYPVWTENGIQNMVGADLKDDEVFVSETGTYFVVSAAPKSAQSVSAYSLNLAKGGKEQKAVDVYRLPFTIWVENFGTNRPCTSADFGGKETVTKDDIIRFLGGAYRIFRSQSRKFSLSYDRNSATVGVAVVSGEKGAAVKAVPVSSKVVNFFDARERLLSSVKERVEETALGLFKGYENDEDMLSLDVFEMSLPKIPGSLLDTIIKEFKRDLTREDMVQIYYSVSAKSYYLVRPKAVYDKISVRYQMTHTKDILVMSVHSHNTMPAVFSRTDDEDEIYTGLFGVIGDLDKSTISMSFRAGMEGKFKTLYYADIFTNGGDVA